MRKETKFILHYLSYYSEIPVEKIISKISKREVCQVRQLGCFLLDKYTNFDYYTIRDEMGIKSELLVWYSIKSTRNLLEIKDKYITSIYHLVQLKCSKFLSNEKLYLNDNFEKDISIPVKFEFEMKCSFRDLNINESYIALENFSRDEIKNLKRDLRIYAEDTGKKFITRIKGKKLRIWRIN